MPGRPIRVRITGWVFGGEIAKSLALRYDREPDVVLRAAGARDWALWGEEQPLHRGLLQSVRLGVETIVEAQSPVDAFDLRDLHGPLKIDGHSLRVVHAIDLVRLVCAPDLQTAFIEMEVHRDHSSQVWYVYNEFKAGLSNAMWSFSSTATSKLSRYWPGVRNPVNAAGVALPLRRWGMSRQRRWDDDRLTDCWVGLEALAGGTLKSPVGKNLAIRLVQEFGWSQGRLETGLTRSYQVRNDVVHGRTYSQASVSRAIRTADGVLARGLLKRLDMAATRRSQQ